MKKIVLWTLVTVISVTVLAQLNWHYLMTEEERGEVLARSKAKAEADEKIRAAKAQLRALKEERNWEKNRLTYAPIMCERFVEEALKAPSTARFQPIHQMDVMQLAGSEFLVNGYVDAQNGFGAMIRTQFNCQVAAIGRDSWRLVSMNISP